MGADKRTVIDELTEAVSYLRVAVGLMDIAPELEENRAQVRMLMRSIEGMVASLKEEVDNDNR